MTLNNGSRYLGSAGEGQVPQWNGVYPAIVVSNADPNGQGALQLNVPMVSGTTVTDWAPPLGPYTTLPTLNQPVQVMFLGGDVQHPVWVWNEKITGSSVGVAKTTYSPVPPESPNVGDIWFPTVTTGGTTAFGNPQQWTFDPNTSTFSWVTQGSLNGGTITPGTVNTPQISNNAINTEQLANGAVTTGQIATAAVTTYAVQDAAITGTNIANSAIDTPHLAAGAVTAANIEAGTVVAGIINGTEIDSAVFKGINFIINSNGAFWYANPV